MGIRLLSLRFIFLTGLLFVFANLSFTHSAQAQGFPAHTVDLSARVGSSNLDGLDGKDHVTFGFSGGYNLSRFVAVDFDYDVLPQGSGNTGFGADLGTGNGYQSYFVTMSRHLQLYGSSIRVGLGRGHIAVPYLVLGGGASLLTTQYNLVPTTGPSASLAGTQQQHGSYLGGGAGVNISLGHHFGLRPEVRYEAEALNPVVIYNDTIFPGEKNIARGTIALYYHFGVR